MTLTLPRFSRFFRNNNNNSNNNNSNSNNSNNTANSNTQQQQQQVFTQAFPFCAVVESAEFLNLTSETPTVFHGRELLAVSRDVVLCSQWLRKEAARQGYAWRQRRRAQQLCSLSAACVPPGGVVGGEALRLAPPGAGVLVETHWELATRGKKTSTIGKNSGEGFGTARRPSLRWSLVFSIEDRISESGHKVVLTGAMKAEFELFRHATLSHCNDTKWQALEVLEGKFRQLTHAIMLDLRSLASPDPVLDALW